MKPAMDHQPADKEEGIRIRKLVRSLCVVNCLALVLSLNAGSAIAQEPNGEKTLSKQFTQSAITAMVSIHQAKESIATVVDQNLPDAYYNPNLASRATLDVRTAKIEATTNDDQQVAAMLDSYFVKVQNWGLKYKSARESMNATHTTGERFLANDSEWQAIEACEKGLNSVLTARNYSNVASCQ